MSQTSSSSKVAMEKATSSTTATTATSKQPPATNGQTKTVVKKKSVVKPPMVQPPPPPSLAITQQTPEQLQQELYLLQTLQQHQAFSQYPASLLMYQQQAAAQQHMLQQYQQQALLQHAAAAKMKTDQTNAENDVTESTQRARKRPRQEMENSGNTVKSPKPNSTTTTAKSTAPTTTAAKQSQQTNGEKKPPVKSATTDQKSTTTTPSSNNAQTKVVKKPVAKTAATNAVKTTTTTSTTTSDKQKPSTNTTTSTANSGSSTTIDQAMKRIKELEAQVTQLTQKNEQLTEQNQQKQNTIQLLTQHNVALAYQLQVNQQQMTSQYLAATAAAQQATTSGGTHTVQTPSQQSIKSPTPSETSDIQSTVTSPSISSAHSTPTPQSPQKTIKKIRKLDEVEAVIYVEAIEHIVPLNIENELKKFFAKVNNGGKRGILAVHAGDGLDTVARAVTVALKQVDRVREKALEQQENSEKCKVLMNLCVQLLGAVTRAVATGLLALLDSAISQLMDGTRGQYGLDMANQLETCWKSVLDLIFQDSDTSPYTALGALLDETLCQTCAEELNVFGKALNYFKMEHLSRMFKVMFTYMKKNQGMEWYLNFCLNIRCYKEYCAKMCELGQYKECLDIILDRILAGPQANRTGSYMDEDKTYIAEYAVLCLRQVLCDDLVAQNKALEEGKPLQESVYTHMLEKIMANCINIHPRRIFFPREIVPLLIFILELFPSENAFVNNGDTGQDIRHLTFIADLLFIIVRNIVELDTHDESIDSVKSVGRRIVLECTSSLLEKLLAVKQSPFNTRLKEIIEYDMVFKRSLAQICEKAIWIPIHLEEKDYSWKSVNNYLETLQVRQDDHTEPLRRSVLLYLKQLIPSVADYLEQMMRHLNVALHFKIENRNNSSYDEFFVEMKAIGTHYFRSGRERQWEELLSKIFFIHSRKVKLKKMLKTWNGEQVNKDGRMWYDSLLEEEEIEEIIEEVEEDEIMEDADENEDGMQHDDGYYDQ
jgi:hypothetical protein